MPPQQWYTSFLSPYLPPSLRPSSATFPSSVRSSVPLSVHPSVPPSLLLPGETISEEYSLEYGTDKIEMHLGAVSPGDRVLLVDDLVATGGPLGAGIRLLGEREGGVGGVGKGGWWGAQYQGRVGVYEAVEWERGKRLMIGVLKIFKAYISVMQFLARTMVGTV